MATSRPKKPVHNVHNGVNQLRIIGGEWRSRKLSFPDAPGLRPTPDRVRETLFNWLAPYVPGAKVLDPFTGSGALFLEALSRGAAMGQALDPPFNQNLLPAVCTLLEERQWLADDAWVYTESETAPSTLGLPGNWRLHREQKSGRVYYSLWQRMAEIAG